MSINFYFFNMSIKARQFSKNPISTTNKNSQKKLWISGNYCWKKKIKILYIKTKIKVSPNFKFSLLFTHNYTELFAMLIRTINTQWCHNSFDHVWPIATILQCALIGMTNVQPRLQLATIGMTNVEKESRISVLDFMRSIFLE